jgi:hypothetical protein
MVTSLELVLISFISPIFEIAGNKRKSDDELFIQRKKIKNEDEN